jgi:hypothetical protein
MSTPAHCLQQCFFKTVRAEAQWLNASRSRSHRPRECLRCSLARSDVSALQARTLRCRRSQELPVGQVAQLSRHRIVISTDAPSHSISCGVRQTGAFVGGCRLPNHKRPMPMRARAMFQNGQVRGNASRIAGVGSFWDQQGPSIPHHCCRLPNRMQIVPTWPRIRRATQARLHRLVS